MLFFLLIFTLHTDFGVSDTATHKNWHLLNHEKCGDSAADRIIGGKDAAMGAYPWIARIGYLNAQTGGEVMFRCGAVMLNTKTILTAAHCVSKLPNGLKVGVIRLGEHNTDTDPDCEDGVCSDKVQDFKCSEIIIHKDYGNPAFKNDVALIRLQGEIQTSNYVKPICFISGDLLEKTYIGETAEVAGWGIYDIEDPKSSVILQTIKLPVVDNELCKTSFSRYASIGPTQMCVGGTVGEDSCGGDSGGPLMKVDVGDGPPRYYLIGIVSFGAKKCGATTMPGVYTRLSSFSDWILDNLESSVVDFEVIKSD